MTRRSLVIDSKDQGQFFLLVEGGTVTIGGSRKHADTVLQQLQVRRIRCELEVEGEHVTLNGNGTDPAAHPRVLKPGEVLDAGGSHFHLEVAEAHSTSPTGGTLDEDDLPRLRDEEPASEEDPSPPTVGHSEEALILRKRLVVIDGADMGRSFMLPESGSVTIGKDRKYADIHLHDLYVSRVNCQVAIDGDKVTVVHQAGVSGTLINGRKITEQVMLPGDVLRVGNSHLRLECVAPGEEFAKVAGPQEEEEDTPISVAGDSDGDDAAEEIEVVEDDDDTVEEVEVVEDEGNEAEAADEVPESVRVLRVLRDKLTQLTGHTFGHYRLGTVLGRGSTGVVFRADNVEAGQVVALKVFLPFFPHGDQELTRFARVMKGLLPLRHPHLVSLYRAGKTGTYTWIAREFVEGESLSELFRRLGKSQRLDWQLGLRVGIQLGQALDFARKHHLRHGKITPNNVFLHRGDKNAKLADLMLGSALEGSRLWLAGQEHWPTSELAFLSPEQTAQGAFVDELSDIYSLGAVVYALLTGRPPFEGETREELIEKIQGPNKPARPSKLNDDVPASLDKVVMKMLTKRQEDRYQTPAELLHDLEPIEEEVAD